MSEQVKPVSKWTASKLGGIWANKDESGKVKHFSGSINVGGKEMRIFVSKRLKFDNDDPAKSYPDLIIYDSTKLDSFGNQPAEVKTKTVPVTKKVAKPAVQEEEVAEELV